MMFSKIAAVLIPATLYLAAGPGALPGSDQADGERPIVRFETFELPAIGDAAKSVRRVHPDFARISGWVSSVGAAVALYDHDGDGISNDYCLVDPRYDSVTIAPVPTTGERFRAFALPWTDGASTPGTVAPMGCLPADIDEDGRQDLVVYFWGRGPAVYLAAEDFVERRFLPQPEVWNTNAGIVADFNGDGRLDLFFGNYFPDGLEVLGTAGTARMQHSMSRARNAGRNRLFLATGQGLKFVDRSEAVNAAAPNGWTLGAGAVDFDGDLLPELYVANDFGPDHLLHNRSTGGDLAFAKVEGRRGLTDARSRVLGRDSFKGMGVDFGDIDRDGRLDIYVSNIAEDYALMESHLLFRGTGEADLFAQGQAPFEEMSGDYGLARSSWGWDARFADFDNDGFPEVIQATGFLKGTVDRWPELHEAAMGNDELLTHVAVWPEFTPGADVSGDRADSFFVRTPSGRYVDAGAAHGFRQGNVSRGVAIGDIDADGDVDALIARQYEPSILLRNAHDTAGTSVTVDLRTPLGNGATRPAVGARAILVPEGRPERFAESVPGGEGHSGKSAPELTFGVGGLPADQPLRLHVAWRDRAGLHRRTIPITAGRHRIVLDHDLAGHGPRAGRAEG